MSYNYDLNFGKDRPIFPSKDIKPTEICISDCKNTKENKMNILLLAISFVLGFVTAIILCSFF